MKHLNEHDTSLEKKQKKSMDFLSWIIEHVRSLAIEDDNLESTWNEFATLRPIQPFRFVHPSIKLALMKCERDSEPYFLLQQLLFHLRPTACDCAESRRIWSEDMLQCSLVEAVVGQGIWSCRFLIELTRADGMTGAQFLQTDLRGLPCKRTTKDAHTRFLSWLAAVEAQKQTEQIRVDRTPRLRAEAKAFCSICQDEISVQEQIVQLRCGHVFHETADCSSQSWIRQQGTCPMCRAEITT